MVPSHTLVVGGTRGIGKTLVRRLAAAGDIVSFIGRTPIPELEREGQVFGLIADVGVPLHLSRALLQISKQSVPVSSLVMLQRYRGTGDDWSGEISTTLTATRSLFEWASDHLEERDRGKAVVVISSIAASLIAWEQPVSYHMAKAAIAQMVRYYAVQLGRQHIRVNAISPGTTVKEESKAFYQDHPYLDKLFRDIVPLGRMGTADDVCALIQFLLSNDASFLTGQNIVLDGGASLSSQESLARKIFGLGSTS